MSKVHSRSARQGAHAIATGPARAGFRPAAAALAVAAVFALQPAPVQAQPAGATVVHGQASFAANGNNLLVTTRNGAGTSHSAIDWQSFSVPAGSITRFLQPSADSTSINRVLGPDPSAIFGTLSSNGRLVLVNPAGITVGAGAVVDTAAFTASTLQMTGADAVAGRLRFGDAGGSGALQVAGTVRARNGDVVLIAPDVQAAGPALVQSQGATILAAGQKVEITGRGLEGIHLEVQAGDRAVNLGTLQGDAVGIFAGTLHHSGVVQAQAVSVEGGKVVLKATGDNLVTGAVAAAGADGHGGSIDVLGQRVGLLAGATLDASGAQGGGQVRVGGDYQGRNAGVPNGAQTYVDAGATIKADATGQGDGGRVIVWSDDVTRMHGQVSARGGALGGDGGFTEVSGKKSLEFTGRVDLRAPKGAAGTLLLDPEDLTIFHQELPLPTSTFGPVYGSVNTFPIRLELEHDSAAYFAPTASAAARLSDAHLNAQLALGNVLVTTSSTVATGSAGQITVAPTALVEWSGASHLAMRADQGIDVQGTIRATHGNASLQLRALHGDIVESGAGAIEVPALFAWASGSDTAGGRIALEGSNRVGRFAARADGALAQVGFHNAQSLEIGSVGTVFSGNAELGSGNGIDGNEGSARATVQIGVDGHLTVASGAVVSGGVVSLNATGNVVIAPQVLVAGETVLDTAPTSTIVYGATSLRIEAGKDIVVGGQRSFQTPQVDLVSDGPVSLEAKGGSLSFGEALQPTTLAGFGAHVFLAGNGVDLQAAGDAHFSGDTFVLTNGPALSVTAGGSITGSGTFFSLGRFDTASTDGAISLDAKGGSLAFAQVDSSAAGTPHAGTVTLHARDDIRGDAIVAAGGTFFAGEGSAPTLVTPTTGPLVGNGAAVDVTSESGSVAIGAISTYGGPSSSSAPGTVGSVTVTAKGLAPTAPGLVDPQSGIDLPPGSIAIGRIEAGGGWGATGGDGGTVTLSADHGSVAIGSIDVTGGSSFGGGQGGRGGSVSLTAGGDILFASPPRLTVAGLTETASTSFGFGFGVSADGGEGTTGGRGGDVSLRLGGSLVAAQVSARGGAGSQGVASEAIPEPGTFFDANGGVGGAGGSIALERVGSQPHLGFDAVLEASGGQGGWAGTNTDGSGGAGGAGGTITLKAANGDLWLRGLVHAGAGAGGLDTAGVPAASGAGTGAVDIAARQLTLDATVAGDVVRIAAAASTRTIRLGGADDGTALHLSQGEFDRITAGTLEIGNLNAVGGIVLDGPIVLDEARVPKLRLLNSSAMGANVAGSLTVGSLDARGAGVDLQRVNIAHTLTGSGGVGGFRVRNLSPTDLTIGADGIAGGRGEVQVTTAGRLVLSGAVSGAGTGDAVVLTAGSFEIGQGGAIQAPAGRWLVYLPTPDGSQFANSLGRLDSGNFALWNRTPGQAIPEAGNRYVFALQPQLDAITVLPRTKVYDGTLLPAAASVTGTLVDAALYGNVFTQDVIGGELLVVGQSKNVGTYAVEQGSFGVAGYGVRSFTGGTVTITPRRLNVTLSAQDKVYDGTTAASFSFGDDRVAGDALTLTGTAAFTDRNAGSGKLVLGSVAGLGGADAGNYVLVTPAPATQASIAPRALHVSMTAQDKVYDGTTAAVVGFADDRIAGDALAVAGSGAFVDKNAGNGKLVLGSVAGLTGADAGNYLVLAPRPAAQASIAPRALHLSVAAQDKVYDGTTSATLAASDDRLAGDALDLLLGGRFADKNAGVGKQVTVDALLAGGDAGNYLLALPAAAPTATITPRTLHVSMAAQDKVYDGTTAAVVRFTDDRVAADTFTVSGSGAFADRNAGSGKVVLGSVTGIAGTDAGNYLVLAPAPVAQASIGRRALHVSTTAQDKVYDGTTSATLAASDDRIAGDALDLLVGGRFADRNAGVAKQVTVDALLAGGDAGNYLLALPAAAPTATITPRALHLAASAGNKVYDGTTAASVSLADDRLAGDALTVSASAAFADRNAGTGKQVTLQATGLAGADAANYVLVPPTAALRADITPAALTIAARDATKVEGATLAFNGTEFTASGLVAGETIGSVTLASAGADAAAKANGYAITASAPVGGSGFLAANYRITFQDGLLTVLPPQSQAGTTQVGNQVVTFAQLFVQEALRQEDDRRRNKDDIVLTDTACKPQ